MGRDWDLMQERKRWDHIHGDATASSRPAPSTTRLGRQQRAHSPGDIRNNLGYLSLSLSLFAFLVLFLFWLLLCLVFGACLSGMASSNTAKFIDAHCREVNKEKTANVEVSTVTCGSHYLTHTAGSPNVSTVVPRPEYKVAFVGDSGMSADAVEVFSLLKREDASLLLHLGDLDYEDAKAEAWVTFLDTHLGPKFPVITVAGNHDALHRYGGRWESYQPPLIARMRRQGLLHTCTGIFGVQQWCMHEGIGFVVVAPAILCTKHNAFAQEVLRERMRHVRWKVCAWHMDPYEILSASTRGRPIHGDSIGGDAAGRTDSINGDSALYETCRREGAIIANGHEHDYYRSNQVTGYTGSGSVQSRAAHLVPLQSDARELLGMDVVGVDSGHRVEARLDRGGAMLSGQLRAQNEKNVQRRRDIKKGKERSEPREGGTRVVAGEDGVLLVEVLELNRGDEEGTTLQVVSGLGGKSARKVRTYYEQSMWWSTAYTRRERAIPGALFCQFHHSGDPDLALCYYKNIADELIDVFYVRSNIRQ
eukprot:TRINITY_DN7062_c0_g1_i1.p1 TRINITY_DN7062_c0_g1~~TRINITY_DN7062_c0_g1_i1.p1  ORF type:complete len:534 (-),score=119.29 TRINITY_DN7062_c0_g1_i1:824-2425(-)